MDKQYFIYVMANETNTVTYTGVTNDLKRRVYEHKEKLAASFTKKYNITKVVYYEATPDVASAIAREKQLKGSSRRKKTELIESVNKSWRDLYEEI